LQRRKVDEAEAWTPTVAVLVNVERAAAEGATGEHRARNGHARELRSYVSLNFVLVVVKREVVKGHEQVLTTADKQVANTLVGELVRSPQIVPDALQQRASDAQARHTNAPRCAESICAKRWFAWTWLNETPYQGRPRKTGVSGRQFGPLVAILAERNNRVG